MRRVIGDDLAPEYLMSQKIPPSFESQETFLFTEQPSQDHREEQPWQDIGCLRNEIQLIHRSTQQEITKATLKQHRSTICP